MIGVALRGVAVAARNLFRSAALNLDFTKTQALDPRITFSRASTGTRINASGVLESVATNGPRFDYDPVTLAPRGLLIEEQRTNIQLRSEEFDVSAVWGPNAASVTANTVTSPFGTSTADTIAEDTASNAHGVLDLATTVTSGVTYTFSVYVKAGTASVVQLLGRTASFGTDVWANFNLSTGSIGSVGSATTASIESVNNGWYRCSIRGAAVGTVAGGVALVLTNNNATAGRFPSYVGSGKSLYLWGAQLEAGSFATSYIPTSGAAATRAADVAVMQGANFSNWYRQDEGTLFGDWSSVGSLSDNRIIYAISDGIFNNTHYLTASTLAASNQTVATFRSSNVSTATIAVPGAYVNYALRKTAAAYSINDFAISADGLTAAVDSSGQVQAGVDRLFIGSNWAGSGNYLNGHIRKIAYFPRRLSNAELQGITS